MKKKGKPSRLAYGWQKLFRIMKLSMLFLLVGLMQVSASVYSQTTKLSVDAKNQKIVDVLKSIENQSEFRFFYKNEQVDVNRKVNINVENEQVEAILETMFDGTNISYKFFEDKLILLSSKDSKANVETEIRNFQQQQNKISGKVRDKQGEPLPGVTVVIKGTTQGVVTNIDGDYTILEVPAGSVLVFSFVGMTAQEVVVGENAEYNVVMAEDRIGLDEVVVVGYGIQKKSNITGSIATVESEQLTKVPATNTSALLGGRLPGLNVRSNSGQPGGDESSISIRGFGNALVIVDGVPRDFQQLDPNEIESITVLKDASAAVYGSRAGNGVLLVTTKKGSRNTAPRINFTSNFTMQQPTSMPKMANAVEYATHLQRAELNDGYTVDQLSYPDSEIAKYKEGTAPGYEGTDWQDLTFKNWAPLQQNNINVSGGTDKINYFVSLGNLDQKSILKSGAGEFKRYNVSSNIDVNITEKLKFGLNLKWRDEDREAPISRPQDPSEYYAVFYNVTAANPTISPIPGEPDMIVSPHPLGTSPIAAARTDISGFTKDKRKQMDLLFTMGYELPIKGLSVNGKVALKDYDRLYRGVASPFELYAHDYETGENSVAWTNTLDFVNVHDWKFRQLTTNFSADYANKFGDHTVSGLLLMENIYIDKYDVEAERKNLISSDLPYLYAGKDAQTNMDTPYEDGRQSYVGRFNYDYQGKYLVELLFRADASIQFPTDTRWGFFPGVSLGWRMSEENFLNESAVLDNLKLRASFASLGYDGISNFDYLAGYELNSRIQDKYGYGGQMYQSSLKTIGLANPNITWEEINIYNAGMDATLWNGLLGVEFDAFYRLRTGLLASRIATVPTTFGAVLPRENLEERDNRGFELVLNHKNNFGDLNYSVTGNVTWTREKYVYKEERVFDAEDPDDARLNKRTGEWTNRKFGYKSDGFWNTQAELDANKNTYPEFGAPGLGDIRYVDTNGDDIINYRDQVVIGKGDQPELYFGLNMDLEYKGFDFSMLLQGASGFDIFAHPYEINPRMTTGAIPYQYMTKYVWTPENTANAKFPAPVTDNLNTHNAQSVDMFLRNGTYLRLKSINLGYSLPQSLIGKVNIKNARVYVAAYNLLTFMQDSFYEIDPESYYGASQKTYPLQRTITLGVNIGI